jgi:chaperonin GroES
MQQTNGSGINPVEYNVIVLPKQVEEKTAGGLYLPQETKEKEEYARKEGVLVAVSPMAFSFVDWPAHLEDEKPKVGDTVVFPKYQAEEFIGVDGQKYWLMKDKAIIGVKE